jgi:hypothetical protein
VDAHSVSSISGLRSGILEGSPDHGAGAWQAPRFETVDRGGIVSLELTLVDGTNCGDRACLEWSQIALPAEQIFCGS